MSKVRAVRKVLSRNDTGETHSHQAGILVPKNESILGFFPELDGREFNPRVHLAFQDSADEVWEFAFIYYNNALFGGTRNEYRLTRMTPYINQNNLKEGDSVILSVDDNGVRHIGYERRRTRIREEPYKAYGKGLRLNSSWKSISI